MFLLYLHCSHQYLWAKLDKTENTFSFSGSKCFTQLLPNR